MTLSTESDPSLYVNLDEVVFVHRVMFEKQVGFRMSKAEIEKRKTLDPDYNYKYAGLVDAPE